MSLPNPEPAFPGWLPLRIVRDARTNRVMVPWVEFGAGKLADLAFDQTVAQLLRAAPPARQAGSSLDAILNLARPLPRAVPAGFVFHVSHCGAELVAHALRTAADTVVVSEAPPFSNLLHPDAELFSGEIAAWPDLRQRLYYALASLFACYRTGEPEQIVLKFPSWCLLYWRIVRAVWPEVPCVVILRDPVEVMVNSMAGGGWMDLKQSPEQACRLLGWSDPPRPVDRMTDEEYAARILGSFFDVAAGMPVERTRMVDYRDLDAAGAQSIGEYFGLAAPLEQIERMISADSLKRERARAQSLATPLLRTAAFQWAAPGYERLKRRA